MNESMTAIFSLISIGILWFMLFWMYRNYRIDVFRQEMFSLRDSLFDEAANGNISQSSETYRILRTTMNGAIRFAHRVSFVQLLVLGLVGKKYGLPSNSFNSRLKTSLKSLNSEQRKLAEQHYFAMNFLIARHVILSSPILLITVIVPLAFFLAAKNKIAKLNKELKRPLDKIDAAAFAAGRI